MPSEREFLQQRLVIVERRLAHPDPHLIYTGDGRGRYRQPYEQYRCLEYENEERVLRKLLAQTHEGQATKALKSWRRHLETFLRQHYQQYRDMQVAYDAWTLLPFAEREITPCPPRPPAPILIDQGGNEWFVDDQLLAAFDDLATRLQQWLTEE